MHILKIVVGDTGGKWNVGAKTQAKIETLDCEEKAQSSG
jgi:hypothetical protein